ncbi:MAG TPA: SLBB domain-containing protein [Syntrophobacteraceae bacterium]|nr:SLBB domain-containing protein [Syntrophobacteraceae bacterium]
MKVYEPSRLIRTALHNRVTRAASRHSGMFPAGIQKNFLDTGLTVKPAGMTKGDSDTYFRGAVPGSRPSPSTHRTSIRSRRSLSARLLSCSFCVLLLWVLASLSACYQARPAPTEAPPPVPKLKFETAAPSEAFATADVVDRFSQEVPEEYFVGPGDVFKLTIWHRPEVSDDNVIVGPDGTISVNRIGTFNASGKTVTQLADEIAHRLSKFYESPEVTIAMKSYNNNKAFVLGRVANPGVVRFPGKGTLLEALALAGGLPASQTNTILRKCSIIRGKETVIWVDLNELLHKGNTALNAAIRNNDIVFIPEGEDELVYVMGEVAKPGAVPIRTRLTYLDAVMLAGGPTKDANLAKTYLVRSADKQGSVVEVDLEKQVETGVFTQNYVLHANDIIYVSPTTLSRFSYIVNQFSPMMQVITLGIAATK